MKSLKIYAVLFLAVLVNLSINAQQVSNDFINMNMFIEKYKSDTSLVVLDVRTEAELSGPLGRLERIVHIPIQQLQDRFNELSKYKDKEIAVICRTGARSDIATQFLREKEFNAKNVLGGMVEFRKLNHNK